MISPEFTSCIYILPPVAETREVPRRLHRGSGSFPRSLPEQRVAGSGRLEGGAVGGRTLDGEPGATGGLNQSLRLVAPLPGPADMIKELAA